MACAADSKASNDQAETFEVTGEVDQRQVDAIAEITRAAGPSGNDCVVIRCDRAEFFDVRALTALSDLRNELAGKSRRLMLEGAPNALEGWISLAGTSA